MQKKAFFLPCAALAVFVLFALPAWAVQKTASLADFNGTWLFDAEKSQAYAKEAAGKLKELTGFKFTINAKAGTMRMEWADFEPRVRKFTATRAEGAALSCDLEGYKAAMLLEKVNNDEILVKDREEALVFVRVK